MIANTTKKEVIFSGIQPTGSLHIGNYLGAIQNWLEVLNKSSEDTKFFFSIVDLHAITIHQNPKDLKDSIYKTFATYLACGLNPERYKNLCLFVQSDVVYHSYLSWILSCNCQIGLLDRMTQYKSKTAENKERACLGLYAYPVLMAADILLYDTTVVPVGEDQVQHIELARDIAIKMNSKFKENMFCVPSYRLNQDTKRIMSLQDGKKKMSKSDPDPLSTISLFDNEDQITKKIKKAKTDTISGIFYEDSRSEVNNLISIFCAFSGMSINEISDKYSKSQTSVFKTDLTDLLIAKLIPVKNKIDDLLKNRDFLKSQMLKGSERANNTASKKIQYINNIIGLGTNE